MAYLHHVVVAPRLAFSSHGDAPPCVPKVAFSYHKHIAVAARPLSRARHRASLTHGAIEEDQLASSGSRDDRSMEPAAEEEKVFVAVPAERRAGQSTLAWALRHLYGGAGTTIVVAHVRVPSQMIPIMGVKFHASKLSPEPVRAFRRAERERADEMLDDYVHQCSEIKVKCEKLVIEKDDATSGLVELIRLHRITKLVIAAAADRHYSRKLDKPVSKTATEIMQRADPSCKIWFVCKEQLVCTRDKEVQIAPLAVAAPLLPILGHEVQHLQSPQEEDDIEMELGFDDELQEARKRSRS